MLFSFQLIEFQTIFEPQLVTTGVSVQRHLFTYIFKFLACIKYHKMFSYLTKRYLYVCGEQFGYLNYEIHIVLFFLEVKLNAN